MSLKRLQPRDDQVFYKILTNGDDNITPPVKSYCKRPLYKLTMRDRVTIPPDSYKTVYTGISFHFPANTYGRLALVDWLKMERVQILNEYILPDNNGTELSLMLHNYGTEEAVILKRCTVAYIELVPYKNYDMIQTLKSGTVFADPPFATKPEMSTISKKGFFSLPPPEN